MKWAALALVLLSSCGKGGGGGSGGFDDATHADLTARLTRADEQTAALEAARLAGITAAATGAEPAAPRTCPEGLALMRGTRVDNFVRLVARDVPAPDAGTRRLADTRGLRATEYDRASSTARDLLRRRTNRAGLEEELARLGAVTFWAPHELAFVVTRVDPPKVPQPGPYATFYPGSLAGRVIVWSYERGQVACWMPIEVSSAAEEEVTMGDTSEQKNESLLYTLYSDADVAALKALGASGSPGDLLDRTY